MIDFKNIDWRKEVAEWGTIPPNQDFLNDFQALKMEDFDRSRPYKYTIIFVYIVAYQKVLDKREPQEPHSNALSEIWSWQDHSN